MFIVDDGFKFLLQQMTNYHRYRTLGLAQASVKSMNGGGGSAVPTALGLMGMLWWLQSQSVP